MSTRSCQHFSSTTIQNVTFEKPEFWKYFNITSHNIAFANADLNCSVLRPHSERFSLEEFELKELRKNKTVLKLIRMETEEAGSKVFVITIHGHPVLSRSRWLLCWVKLFLLAWEAWLMAGCALPSASFGLRIHSEICFATFLQTLWRFQNTIMSNYYHCCVKILLRDLKILLSDFKIVISLSGT